jgi:hypothetical protein
VSREHQPSAKTLTNTSDAAVVARRRESSTAMPASLADRRVDSSELEAERAATGTDAQHDFAAEGADPPHRRLASRSHRGKQPATPRARQVIANAGQRLEPVVRAEMERLFGCSFADVRIHSDALADASARELGARAYTSGNHIVFATGEYAPDTPAGRRLIAHELTHVVQQLAAPRAGAPIVQLQPGNTPSTATAPSAAPVPPKVRTVKTVLADLKFSRTSNRGAIPRLIQELLTLAESPGDDLELLNDGLREVTALSQAGDIASADRLLAAIAKKFKSAFIEGKPLPSGGFRISFGSIFGDPRAIIDLAKDAARAGAHERAFNLFGTAHEMLTMYAHRATSEAQRTGAGDFASRYDRYSTLKGIFGEMREIYRFYSTLEVEALTANDLAAANEARAHATSLRSELKRNRTHIPDLEVETAETTQVKTSKGDPAFRFHGANYEELDLTELPGHPFPAQVLASKEALTSEPLKDVQDALIAQAGFQAEISYEPEVRKAFANQDVDVNVDAQRLKLWRVMYGVYKRRGNSALGRLLALIGRYLKAYGYHTSYNVRDFGKSYLDTPMPSDVAGRLVYDCGVYALSVAWDVFRTVKSEDSKLDVRFTLATLLDHIVLVIRDNSADEYYLVNNDRITRYSKPPYYEPSVRRPPNLPEHIRLHFEDPPMPPPKLPDLEEKVGEQYAMVRNLPYLVSPVTYLDTGTTRDSIGSFKSNIWSRYLAATSYMAQVPVNFLMLEDFSRSSATLDALVDQIAPSADDPQALTDFLSTGEPEIISLLIRFEQIGTKAFEAVPKGISPPQGLQKGGAFRWPGSNHPLVRVAMIMLRLEALGGSLSANQRKFLNFFEAKFKDLMDKNRADAERGRF